MADEFQPFATPIDEMPDDDGVSVVLVDKDDPTRKAVVTSDGELRVIVTGGGTAGQLVQDGAAWQAGDVGRVSVGFDGTNYQFIKTDSDGNLQIDVLTIPSVTIGTALPAGDNNIGNVDVVTMPNVTLASQTNPFTTAIPADVSDRAGRLLGVVYGSQGQQLKQTATNYNLQVELATGGTLYDARQVRTLTASDIVTANQGSPNASSANAWFTKIVDGAGTNIAGVDAQNHLYVSGKSAAGVAPTTNPVSVSGVDGGGLKRSFLLDTSGRIQANIAQWFGSTVPTVGQKSMGNSIPVTIASDQSPIPVGGILSWVDNGYMFCCSSEQNAASSGANNPIYLIKNPIGSGKNLYLWKIQAGTNVTNVAVVFRVFIDPTVTANGTADTIVQRNIGSAVTSIAQVYTLPTVSSSGTEISALSSGQNNNAIVFTDDFSVKLQPGHSLLITAKPNTNGRSVVMTCIWAEVA